MTLHVFLLDIWIESWWSSKRAAGEHAIVMAHPTLALSRLGLEAPEFHICQDLRYPSNHPASDASIALRVHIYWSQHE